MEISLLELWGTMGWFARGIVLVLLLMSMTTATVVLRKLVQLRAAREGTRAFAPAFPVALAAGDFAQAERLVEQHGGSPIASAFRGVLPSLDLPLREHPLDASEIASAERLIELNTLEQRAQMQRGLSLLATVGATAPFVGLLGTTMGVVHAFTGMAASGSAGLAAISAGIAEALIVTAMGLLVAIPAVWLYNFFVNQIDQTGLEINFAAKQFQDFLLRFPARHTAPRNGRGAAFNQVEAIAVGDVDTADPALVASA